MVMRGAVGEDSRMMWPVDICGLQIERRSRNSERDEAWTNKVYNHIQSHNSSIYLLQHLQFKGEECCPICVSRVLSAKATNLF